MREILFRGKMPDGEWAVGFLVKGRSTYILTYENIHYMTVSVMGHASVDVLPVERETVGQYVGLKDENGKRIFEGDIVTFKATTFSSKPCVVEYLNSDVCYVARRGDRRYPMDEDFVYKVIGNIHDNPKLIGGAEDGK